MIFNKSIYNEDWETLALSALGTFKRGKSKHRPRNDYKLFENGLYPLVQTGEIKNANLFIENHHVEYNEFGLSQSKIWPKGTLCITIAANIAETALLSYPMCFPDSVVGFNSFKDKSTELFTHYILTYIKRAIQNAASGSIQDNINIDFLTKLNFKVPKLSTQKIIAKVLSDLDAKIALNTRINTELEKMAKTLYDYWFVQFDFPNEEGKPYKSSGGKMVFSPELGREIPWGWEVKGFGDYAKVKSGFAFKSTWWKKTGIPVVKIKDIQGDYTLNQGDFSYVPNDKVNIAHRFKGKAGDIVIAMTGATIGKFAIVPYMDRTILVNQRVGLYDLGSEPFDRAAFLFNSMKQDFFKEKVLQIAGGAAQPNISGDQLDSFPLLFPNNELIELFNNKGKSIYRSISTNIKQNHHLTQLRDWLLPMLMNGQVRVE